MFDRWHKAEEFAESNEPAFSDPPPRGTPSLAREALAVAIDPTSGKVWNGGRFIAPCALLMELVWAGRLSVSGTGKKARVQIIDPAPLGDPDLDQALVTIGTGMESDKVVSLLDVVPQTSTVLQSMVADGALIEESQRRLGLFTVHRFHTTPLSRRDELAGRLRSALVGESAPDERTAMLMAALVGVHPKVVVRRGEVNEAFRRIPEVCAAAGEGEQAILAAAKEAQGDANYSRSTL